MGVGECREGEGDDMRLNRQDADLHYPDGTHRSTAPTANGAMLAQYETRLRRHLAMHGTTPELKDAAERVKVTGGK